VEGCLVPSDKAEKRLSKVEKRLPRVKDTFLKKSKYRHLLDDPQVNRWFRNNLRGSAVTAAEQLRRLGWICKHFDTTPQELARLPCRKAENFLLDTVSLLEDDGKRSSYIANMLKAAKSWFRFNRKHIEVNIKLTRESGLFDKEKPPTLAELRRILDAADTRQKVGVALMSFSGFRDQALGDYTGVDGLKVSDFPEMSIRDGKVEFDKIPTLVKCRASISKIGYEYASFLSQEGCGYLQNYLEERMRRRKKETKQDGKTIEVEVPGETLNPDAPIITPKQLHVGTHIRTTNIADMLKKAITRAGFNYRPYAFRRYFATRMMHAEEGGLLHSYSVLWMGHAGEMLMRYTLEKGLDDETREMLRAAYKKADEAHLTTRGRREEVPEAKVVATLRREWLKYSGYGDEEIAKLGDLSKLTHEQVQELTRKSRQKVVAMSELKQLIAEGWEFVASLPNDEAVVRLPTALAQAQAGGRTSPP
jgi:integrase